MIERLETIELHFRKEGGDWTWEGTSGELVRCKDCKFAKLIDKENDWYECWYDKRVMHGDGYCSWAERKEECQ